MAPPPARIFALQRQCSRPDETKAPRFPRGASTRRNQSGTDQSKPSASMVRDFLPFAFPDFAVLDALPCPRAPVICVKSDELVAAPPLPSTEFELALPGEFCTWEIAFALAWDGPCEFERATLRTDGPTGEPLMCALCAAAETVAPCPEPPPPRAAQAGKTSVAATTPIKIGRNTILRMICPPSICLNSRIPDYVNLAAILDTCAERAMRLMRA